MAFSIAQFLPLCKKKTPNLCRFDVFCADCSATVWSEWRESNSRPLEPHLADLPFKWSCLVLSGTDSCQIFNVKSHLFRYISKNSTYKRKMQNSQIEEIR